MFDLEKEGVFDKIRPLEEEEEKMLMHFNLSAHKTIERQSVCKKRISSMNDNGLTRTYIHSYAERYVNDLERTKCCSFFSRHWNVQLCVHLHIQLLPFLFLFSSSSSISTIKHKEKEMFLIIIHLTQSFIEENKFQREILFTLLKDHLSIII